MLAGSALTPLCPAGHLPLKGGDWSAHMASQTIGAGDWRNHFHRVISPLEGEMAGKPEGGNSATPLSSRKAAGLSGTHWKRMASKARFSSGQLPYCFLRIPAVPLNGSRLSLCSAGMTMV